MNIDTFLWVGLATVVVAALAGIWWCLQRQRQSFLHGQSSQESALAVLQHERDTARQRVEELAVRLSAAESGLSQWRERCDQLSDERAALSVRAERQAQLEVLTGQLRTELQTLHDNHSRLAAQRSELETRLQEQQRAAEQRLTDMQERLAAEQAQSAKARQWSEQLHAELQTVREAAAREATQRSELETRLLEQQKATEQRMREFDERLKAELAQLAQGILEEKTRHFDERSEKQLGNLLTPLREQLSQFNQTVLTTQVEIQSLKQLNQQITEEAANLTRALKGDSRTQGVWGEQVLERLLEMSGLQEGRGFDLQTVFKTEDGERPRPDVIVHLPDEKDVVIDAKVSLVAWDRALSSTDEASHEQAMKEHLASLRRHIEGLSKRDYTQLPGLRSLDFVLMFVPIEAAFIEAVRRDDALYQFALERHIALVSPSTLLATLRTVAHLWRLEDRNLNAQEIARQAGALHDAFVMLENELTQVGTQLEKALRTHESTIKRISTGRGNLVGRVNKLRRLGADTRKQLPEDRFESEDSESQAGSE